MYTYVQDVTDQNKVNAIFAENSVEQVDFIQSDMAPNTI
jgi:23S rRNA U2552 (ribose-2'-O)-methylase RlmE/FtsJ